MKSLSFSANYTYNNSRITKFNIETKNISDDLTNKFISETPPHQIYAGINFKNKIVDINLATNFISSMWADEFNMQKLDPYTLVDIRLAKRIKQFRLALDLQNILNYQYIDKKNGLSPGRFFIMEIGYRFSK